MCKIFVWFFRTKTAIIEQNYCSLYGRQRQRQPFCFVSNIIIIIRSIGPTHKSVTGSDDESGPLFVSVGPMLPSLVPSPSSVPPRGSDWRIRLVTLPHPAPNQRICNVHVFRFKENLGQIKTAHFASSAKGKIAYVASEAGVISAINFVKGEPRTFTPSVCAMLKCSQEWLSLISTPWANILLNPRPPNWSVETHLA